MANFGKQPCLPLASAVTTIGRQLIEKTKAFCEQYVVGSEIIYGDTDSILKLYFVVWRGPWRTEARYHADRALRHALQIADTPNGLEMAQAVLKVGRCRLHLC